MALEDKKISDLNAATEIASNDLLVVVDSSKHETKKITFTQFKLLGGFFGGFQSSLLIDDKTYMGVTMAETVTANSKGFGGALCIDSSGNFINAGAEDSAAVPCVALALAAGSGLIDLLTYGLIRDNDWAWSPGGLIYLSKTAGEITQEIPIGEDVYVQIVGIAQNITTLFFNPSYAMVRRTA